MKIFAQIGLWFLAIQSLVFIFCGLTNFIYQLKTHPEKFDYRGIATAINFLIFGICAVLGIIAIW